MRVTFHHNGLPAHMTSHFIQASTLALPAFLSLDNRLHIAYRNRFFMSTTKSTLGVKPSLWAIKNEVIDGKPNADGAIEYNKPQWQVALDHSSPASKAPNVKQDPDSEECLGEELKPSRKRLKTRQSFRKYKDAVPVIKQEKGMYLEC